MELKIKTLKGSCVLSVNINETKTVGDLQALLHQQQRDDPLHIPQPEQQRLVRADAADTLPHACSLLTCMSWLWTAIIVA
jgi:hypothetical protein